MPDFYEKLKLQSKASRASRFSLLAGIVFGVVYGLLFRLSTDANLAQRSNHTSTMTLSFLVLGSFFVGLLTVYLSERVVHRNAVLWIVAPWPSILLASLLSVVFRIEGLICLIFALPIALVFSSVGGLVGGAVARKSADNFRTVSCVALVPFLLAPAETYLTMPVQTHTVASEIVIHASPSVIWHNIIRVPPISPAELQSTWTHQIGFPRPVEATLSYEGAGGIRHASFERGLVFIETVTAWEPEHRIAFSIKADTAHIPPTTLDEHVTIGGPYFDVLDGEYRLESLPNGDTLLHLTSHQRLSTDFNSYAGLWSDAVMQNLQISILKVIQHRCEHT
ncbi:hypothetical protein RBB79_11930 [Tunturiibacter empetritectus]|uniref:SRPBCC family protein n=2 Tax=Tunturiibacter TaxID=3154218 RepID=A0A852VBM5_9BACT|nr:hypothetical protein [Edaphobacter lichenicola]NYF90293.1 hypothetical protein [Edaphobacter lichenicola]